MSTNAPEYADRRPDIEALFRNTATDLATPLRERTREVAARLFGLSAADLGPFQADDRLGPYTIRRLLGLGGQAFVYEATHAQLGRTVALKVPREEVAERLLKEARLCARLEHPHLVRVEDVREDSAQGREIPYLVMERCTRGSLEDRLEQHPDGLPLDEVRRVSVALLSALGYAHSQGVVHRDLKPANVLFDDQDQPKLSDFGIGHAATAGGTLQHSIDHSRLTQEGVVVGTPQFWAPEQENPALLQGETIDGRADLFSFGKLLFVMLTGASPSTIRPPSRMRAGLDPAWDEVVFQLLEEDRTRRPAGAHDVLALLKRITAEPPPLPQAAEPAAPTPEAAAAPQVTVRPKRRTPATPNPALSPVQGTWAARLWTVLALAAAGFGGFNVVHGGLHHHGAHVGAGVMGFFGAMALLWFAYLDRRAHTSVGLLGCLILALPLVVWQPVVLQLQHLAAWKVTNLVVMFGIGSVFYGIIVGLSLWGRTRPRFLPTPPPRPEWDQPWTPSPIQQVKVGVLEFILRLVGTFAKVFTLGCLFLLALVTIVAGMVIAIVAMTV